jgi:hypothetical protein
LRGQHHPWRGKRPAALAGGNAELDAQGLQNLDEIEATIRRYGIDCDFERTGVLVVAVEPYQDEQLRGEGYMDAAQIRAELNSPTFLSGIWEKTARR